MAKIIQTYFALFTDLFHLYTTQIKKNFFKPKKFSVTTSRLFQTKELASFQKQRRRKKKCNVDREHCPRLRISSKKTVAAPRRNGSLPE